MAGQPPKVAPPERLPTLRDRALSWLHRYLALDVQPRTRVSLDAPPVPPRDNSPRGAWIRADTPLRPGSGLRWSGSAAARSESRPAHPGTAAQGIGRVPRDRTGETEDIRFDPTTEADAWNDKGVAFAAAGNAAEAEAAWEAALAAHPKHLEAAFNRGLVLWRHGALTDDALFQHLEAFAIGRGERWKKRFLLSLIQLERGDVDFALTLLEQAARERPGVAEVESTLSRIRAQSRGGRQPQQVIGEHARYVSAVCISADGVVVLSGSYDTTAALWEPSTGRQLRIFEGHTAPVSCALLGRDGRTAVTGSDDGTMRLWDVETGRCQRVFSPQAGRVASIALSADGRLLLWASTQTSENVEQLTLQLWDMEAGRHVRTLEGHTGPVKSVSLSPDGRRAVSGADDQTVRLWNLLTGDCKVLQGHSHFVSAVCFSTEGTQLLSGSWDQTLRLWDAQSGQCVRIFEGHTGLVTSVCLSADSRWALSAGWDGSVRLWEVATGRCLRTFPGHSSLVSAVALSGDGSWGVSGGWDCTVRLWPVSTAGAGMCALQASQRSS